MQIHAPRFFLARIIPLLLAAALGSACTPPEPPRLQQATLLASPKPIADFELVDQHGAPFTLQNLRGHWTFAFFGYTQCPDVCPTSLAMLGQVMRTLEKDPAIDEMPRGLFVSVDPERDTPAQLAQFVPYFYPDFIGATGDPQQLLTLTRQLGILYLKTPGTGADDYLVDHSAAIVLFNPDGEYHALFNVPHEPAKIASDFVKIKSYHAATR
jgi:protein SCO1/2